MSTASEAVASLNATLAEVGEPAVFTRPAGSFSAATFSFTAATHSIGDSGGTLAAKLRAGYYVTITDSAANNGDYKVGTVGAHTAALLTPAGAAATLQDEAAGATIKVQVTSIVAPVVAQAFVRSYTAKEMAGAGTATADFDVVVSPAPFLAAGWLNPPLITKTTDKVLIRGAQRAVKAVDVKAFGTTPVRVNLIIAG